MSAPVVIPDPSCSVRALIVTFLPDKPDEKRYDIEFKLDEEVQIPRAGELFCYGAGTWCVRQVLHSWGQHEHVICLTVSKTLESGVEAHAKTRGAIQPMG